MNGQPKDPEDDGHFVLKEHPESGLVLPDEEQRNAKDENKKNERLSKTLSALKSSLDKADELSSLGRDRFDQEWILQDAAIMVLTQLGEEVKRLPRAFTSARPGVEWTKIAGMRDKLTHDYVDIDLELVWDALAREVPILRSALSIELDEDP
ncbi:MAG TPA: HepT-like ribonuclease domain-containing protein [Acidimicrobiales bacterium]|nr:HepT-like ribonuclease domain-containing protein [Acidimicrobiales bacterium]